MIYNVKFHLSRVVKCILIFADYPLSFVFRVKTRRTSTYNSNGTTRHYVLIRYVIIIIIVVIIISQYTAVSRD